MFRRTLVCCVALCAFVMGMTGGASAAPAAAGTTTFAVVVLPVSVANGYDVHLSGLGLNGPWRGWHLAADLVTSTDCYTDCMVDRASWALYDQSRATTEEWGTCVGAELCQGAFIGIIGGRTSIPLTVTGGYPYGSGDGSLTGALPPGYADEAAAGYLTLSLNLH